MAKESNRKLVLPNGRLGQISVIVHHDEKQTKFLTLQAIHSAYIWQEVRSIKQKVVSQIWCVLTLWATQAIGRIHTPNVAEKAKQEVGSAKQEVGSYLRNCEKFDPLGYIYTLHVHNMAEKPNRKYDRLNRMNRNLIIQIFQCTKLAT